MDAPRHVRPYYIDLGQKDVRTGMYDAFVYDEEGIPRFPYADGLFYNPTFVCHYALYRLDRHLRYGHVEDRDAFVHVSRWLLDHGERRDDAFVFPYRYRWSGMEPPWISALGQGRLLSVFTRAAALTGEVAFAEAARQALPPFERPASQGGVQSHFADGGLAFEEYPRAEPHLVLNGLITALFGLYDLAEAGEARARRLFDEGTAALARNLARYDLGYWSAYDLAGAVPTVAGDGYHDYHIQQLWVLYEMTGEETFRRYAGRWEGYRKGARLHLMRNLSRVYRRLA